jgi:putative SOS response-associated peptidase YedK
MCNLYDVGPRPGRLPGRWDELVAGVLDTGMSYVAPGKDGLVVWDSGGVRAGRMRWGFRRKWAGAINNARDDKLGGGMWGEAWQHRRCLVPFRWFYEWSGEKGKKVRHRISPQLEEWNWFGGLWEEDEEGLSYSIVTTSSAGDMELVHGRMPLLLEGEERERWLGEEEVPEGLVRPYVGRLEIEPRPGEEGVDRQGWLLE